MDKKETLDALIKEALLKVSLLEAICAPTVMAASVMRLNLSEDDLEILNLVITPHEEVMKIVLQHKEAIRGSFKMLDRMRSMALATDNMPEELKSIFLKDLNEVMKGAK